MYHKTQPIKWISTLILMVLVQPIFSQELSSEIFEKIYDGGKSYTMPLKQGRIEPLKNSKPRKEPGHTQN
jgi:hypothetical protein